jgi:hypothetical protein
MPYIGDRVEVVDAATRSVITRGVVLTYNGPVYVVRRDDTGESYLVNTYQHSMRVLADR